jgi:DNA-binding HxlR family transcriptional regulator
LPGLATTIEHNGHQTTISVFDSECPSRLTLDLIADKWAVLVIASIHEGVNRNGAMLRRIDGISQKMLTQTLRRLERDGLVSRAAFNEVPESNTRSHQSARAFGRSSSHYVNGRSPTSPPYWKRVTGSTRTTADLRLDGRARLEHRRGPPS